MKNKRLPKSKPEKTSDKISHEDFLIVGIGAAAGGIQALKVFFENVPADSGMAYVVILHLSPDYDSQLAEVLRSVTQIPVTQVKEKILVAPDQVYVVPPNKSLSMAGGHIIVSPIHTIEERRAPVDIFFRTLAESHHERAVAVVLSGTGANGSMGLKRVKENGGAAFVQNPREAEYSEMPRNSIATDLIDQILNVAEIPPKLIAYKNSRGTIQIPVEPELNAEQHQHKALVEIFALLRERTGHDFSNYKRATILRRIARRINVCNLSGISEYAALIRENAGETQSLLKDLLISVTNFFRDKDAFGFLENDVLPQILEDKTPDDQIRAWVVGCATGEEAYSLAMLLAEKNLGAPQVQIFASDIDEAAVAHSREGFYTLNDAADVSAERLQRFFTKETDGFRVRRELREMVLFANHNLIKDPPFSRLDLVTCRNLLIYLNHSAQKRVMETFHFALRPGKFLFLGNSETIDGASDLYAPVSSEHHIFQSRHTARQIGYPVPESWLSPLQLGGQIQDEKSSSEPETLPVKRISFGDLHLQMLEEYTPSIVVNEEFDIVHLSENSLPYLQIKGGEPTQNLLKLIHPDLRLELRTAFYQATQRQTNVKVMNVNFKIAGREEFVNIYVRPVLRQTNTARGFILVLFERGRENVINAETAVYSSDDTVAGQLEEELVRSKTQLRKSAEQYEIQAEELKASNEELQAMNEELRSTAEEMETGKEELQSLNEELHTVNQELKINIEEIVQTNNDFQNLINSTDIATIFLDRSLRVNNFTPAASHIFNLITADCGHPLSDITNILEDEHLAEIAETVLKTLQTVEREIRAADGRVYLQRILPYRTTQDRINGVVLTFTDVTSRKRAEETLRESEEKYRHVFNSIDEGFCVVEMIFDAENKPVDYRFLENNPAFERLTGLKNVVGKTAYQLIPNLEFFWTETYGRVALTGEPERFENYSAPLNRQFDVHASRVGGETSRRVVIVFQDITKRNRITTNLAFLAEVSQDLVKLTSIGEMLSALGAKIGGYFNASRCAFFEFDETLDGAVCKYDWHQADAPSLVGSYRTSDFYTDEFLRDLRAGKAFVVSDRDADSRVDANNLHALNIASYIVIPISRNEQLQFALATCASAARDWLDDEVELMREITNRIWNKLERARVEEALRESQNQLRLALDAAEMGTFLWYPQEDRAEMDARVLALYGLREGDTLNRGEALAKLVHADDRELFAAAIAAAVNPNGDGKLEMDFRVVHPDGSLHWLNSQGQTFFAGENPPRTALMYGMVLDITTRKRHEANLAFLAETSADFAPLSRAEEIMERVGSRLADYLDLSRCIFSIVDEEADRIECLYAWRRDDSMPDLSGAHQITTFLSEEGRRHYAAGKFTVINDMRKNSLLNPAMLEQSDELGLGSAVDAPYLKDGRWKFLLTAVRSKAGEWRTDEIELIRELAERIYIRIERARAEEAMSAAEERYLALFNSIEQGFCTLEVAFDKHQYPTDYRFLEVSPSFERQTGIPNAAGRWMREIAPEHDEHWFEIYGRIALTGEPERFENYSTPLNRWWSVYAFRIQDPALRRVGVLFFDITDRKLAEKALAESEEKYRTLFESINEGFCIIEVLFDENDQPYDWLFTEVNPAFEKNNGLANAKNKTIRELAPDIEPKWFEIYGRIAKTGEPLRFEENSVALNRWFSLYAFRVGEPSGNCVAVVFTDITERKQAELGALFIAAIAEKIRLAADTDELLSYACEATAKHFGATHCSVANVDEAANLISILHEFRPEGEISHIHEYRISEYPSVFSEELRAGQTTLVNDTLTDSRTAAIYETHYRPFDMRSWLSVPVMRDGVWVSLFYINQSAPHQWTKREIRLLETVAERLWLALEKVRGEEALRESEERLRLLIESADDYAIFTMTQNGIINSWNAGAEKTFGWTETEAVGRSCKIIFTPEDRKKGAPELEMATALKKGRAPDERFHLRKDGSRFYVSGVMTLLKDANGKVRGLVKIARDMTEQIEAEKAVRDKEILQKLVSAQEDERKRIARDLHDELGQQLTALRLKLDAAKKLCDGDELCGKIDEIELLARSIDNGVDFLAWELRPAALDQLGLIAALSNYVRQWSHYSGVSAELLASSVKRTRFAPEIETNLYRIVQEALNNISKHAKAKSVEVMLEKRNDLLVLIIGDDGRGFNPQDKKKRQKGIGLIGMRERAALVKGTFEIESAIGEGTTVFVRVPVGSLQNGGSDYE